MGARRIQPKRVKAKKSAWRLPHWPVPGWLNRRLLGALVLFGGLGSLLGLGGWRLAQPDTLPILAVQVKGEFRYLDKAALHAALSEPASGGFFNVDVRAVKQAAESLPWVDRASVRRVWPDSLRVSVQEQEPLARWRQADGTTMLVNVRGELFAPPAVTAESLARMPLFYAPENVAEVVAVRYQRLASTLAPLGLSVRELGFDQRRAWHLQLSNGLQLLLGRGGDEALLDRFVTAWPLALAAHVEAIERVDLRYTNGFAVRWKAGMAPGADKKSGKLG